MPNYGVLSGLSGGGGGGVILKWLKNVVYVNIWVFFLSLCLLFLLVCHTGVTIVFKGCNGGQYLFNDLS